MRQITNRICGSFHFRRADQLGNTSTDGKSLFLHSNKIADWREDGLWITNAGWSSATTKERLNGLRGVEVKQKAGIWYLNGKEWDGEWVRVSDHFQGAGATEPEDDGGLRAIGMVAKLGGIFHAGDQKATNDWKTRMLKAGLENKGLIMPDDWETLGEDEKERRLDGAIAQLM